MAEKKTVPFKKSVNVELVASSGQAGAGILMFIGAMLLAWWLDILDFIIGIVLIPLMIFVAMNLISEGAYNSTRIGLSSLLRGGQTEE